MGWVRAGFGIYMGLMVMVWVWVIYWVNGYVLGNGLCIGLWAGFGIYMGLMVMGWVMDWAMGLGYGFGLWVELDLLI